MLRLLAAHPAVLDDPEPAAIVDALEVSTVNIRVQFWFDGKSYSFFKVRSSLMRQIKRALQDAGISMPDAAREIIFPKGVQLHRADTTEGVNKNRPHPPVVTDRAEAAIVSTGEGNLKSEQTELKRQALTSDLPEDEYNLLEPNDPISRSS